MNVSTELPGTQAHKKSTYTGHTVRELILAAYTRHKGDEQAILQDWMAVAREDEAMLEQVFIYYQQATIRSIERPAPTISLAARRQEREASTARATKMAEEVVNKIKRIVYMDLVMPNGKRLGDCTGKDVRSFAAFGADLSRYVKPREKVRAVMTESQVAAIIGKSGMRVER